MQVDAADQQTLSPEVHQHQAQKEVRAPWHSTAAECWPGLPQGSSAGSHRVSGKTCTRAGNDGKTSVRTCNAVTQESYAYLEELESPAGICNRVELHEAEAARLACVLVAHQPDLPDWHVLRDEAVQHILPVHTSIRQFAL